MLDTVPNGKSKKYGGYTVWFESNRFRGLGVISAVGLIRTRLGFDSMMLTIYNNQNGHNKANSIFHNDF